MIHMNQYQPVNSRGFKLDCGVKVDNPYDEDNFTAACRTGNLDAVKWYFEHANIDVDHLYVSGKSGAKTTGLLIATRATRSCCSILD